MTLIIGINKENHVMIPSSSKHLFLILFIPLVIYITVGSSLLVYWSSYYFIEGSDELFSLFLSALFLIFSLLTSPISAIRRLQE